MVLRRCLGRLRLRPGLGEAHERRLFGYWLGDAGSVSRPLLDVEQKARAGRRAELTRADRLTSQWAASPMVIQSTQRPRW